MSGAQIPASGAAHAERFEASNASPTYSQSTRFVERAMGIVWNLPSPSRSGSLVP